MGKTNGDNGARVFPELVLLHGRPVTRDDCVRYVKGVVENAFRNDGPFPKWEHGRVPSHSPRLGMVEIDVLEMNLMRALADLRAQVIADEGVPQYVPQAPVEEADLIVARR